MSKTPAEVAHQDQVEAELQTMGRQLGVFYKALKENGIPAQLAAKLTATYNDVMFGIYSREDE